MNYWWIKMFYQKHNAFTLSETLIALVIIGVIAAITVPTLWVNYQEQERIAKVKKMYSSLSNAMKLVEVNGATPDMLGVRDDNMADLTVWFNEYIGNKLLHMKQACYNKKGCWSETGVKMMNKGNHPYNNVGIGWGHSVISVVLMDGSFVCIDPLANGNINYYYKVKVDNPSGAGLVIAFDINGSKKPNTLGKDVFITVFTDKGYVPAYKNATKDQIEKDCSPSGQGFSCLMKYLSKTS